MSDVDGAQALQGGQVTVDLDQVVPGHVKMFLECGSTMMANKEQIGITQTEKTSDLK